jgi:hypothetical protein
MIASFVSYRDISFLYDVPQESAHPQKPDTADKSALRKDSEQPVKKVCLPVSLINTKYYSSSI